MANTAGARDIKAGGAFVELSTVDKGLQRGLLAAQNRLRRFSADISALGASMLKAGTSLLAPMAFATNEYANFSDIMLQVKAKTSATDDEFNSLNDRVKVLSKETTFTNEQIAMTALTLSSMGLNTKQIEVMAEAMLNLSRATGQDVSSSAEIAVNNMKVFGAQMEEATKYADILTVTSNGSAQVVGDLGEALKMAGMSAANAGASFENINAALGVLANRGLRGSIAGAGLRNVYLEMVKQKDLFDKMGIDTQDMAGNLLPLSEIMANTNKVIGDMPNASKLEAFYNLFGTRGMNIAIALSENVDELRKFEDMIRSSTNAASKQSKMMDSEVGGAIRRVGNAFRNVGHEIGEAVGHAFIPYSEIIKHVIDSSAEWVRNNTQLVVNVAKVASGFVAAGAGLLVLAKTISFTIPVLGALVNVLRFSLINSLRAVITTFTLLASCPTWVIVAFGGLIGFLLGAATDAFKGFRENAKNSLGNLVTDAQNNIENFKNVLRNGKIEDAFKVGTLGIKILWHDLIESLLIAWKRFENSMAKGFGFLLKPFYKNVSFDEIKQGIDDETAREIDAFKKEREQFQQEINEIVASTKAQKTEKEEPKIDAPAFTARNISERLKDLQTAADEAGFSFKDKYGTFGSMNLDAINFGAPQVSVEEKMLDKLTKIEKNTRSDEDDDGSLLAY